MATDCTIERTRADGGTLLTIRHPDGGFRRLMVSADGRYRAADGAVPAQVVRLDNGQIDISVADVRYRLPAGGAPTAAP
ncbi:hypothetical protein M9980_04415 [Sphingomonas donggukensis]|uniref:Uncharacterized protein n=1 Tax=Sphingomonas donggukensis TaxID=2949093 RepID=A0ABY4TVN8_9SPHN|nr:hypothetical protein [Sphingomonas donggukensis]URW76469.1 hypothetical protein M9980_04415 [Sphingomonas donggukensis]